MRNYIMVGRKTTYPYEELRLEKRREQNRVNQRKCRLKKKFLLPSKELSPEQNNLKYIEEIMSYFSNYEFNYHLVGTSYINNHTMNSLYDYTKLLMDKLHKDKIIDRSLFFIEGGNGIHCHYHILIKSKDNINLNQYWRTGILKSKKIESEHHKFNLLNYSMKELDVNTKSCLNLKKIDYWDFCGDY